MTLVTLIITSVLLARLGLSGEKGMFVALVIGGVVCTALAVAGAFATDLKIGYWIGATPRNQQRFKFAGVLVSAAACALAMMLLASTYQMGSPQMPAPQASAMREIIVGLMGGGAGVQWILFAFGVIISLILAISGVPALAFALGMYLPIQLNTAVLLGGFIAFLVGKSAKDAKVAKERGERGVLVASGYIAGGSIAGVVAAVLAAVGLAGEPDRPLAGDEPRFVGRDPGHRHGRSPRRVHVFLFDAVRGARELSEGPSAVDLETAREGARRQPARPEKPEEGTDEIPQNADRDRIARTDGVREHPL